MTDREGRHRHEMISSSHHMESSGSETGENNDQQGITSDQMILQDDSPSLTNQASEPCLHILLAHQ